MAASKPARCCFRLTPGRLLPVLLATEGCVWLADWLRWIPKGYGVLIAVAGVGVFLLLMFLWFIVALFFRWRFQYSLLSLLTLVLAVALPCSWLATEMKMAKGQREWVDEITKAGGGAGYDYQYDVRGNFIGDTQPPASPWFRKVLGVDLFADIHKGNVSPTAVGLKDSGD